MKRLNYLLTAAAVCLVAAPAYATNPNDDDTTLPGCNPSGSTPQKCDDTNNGGDGGDGGAGGQGGDGGSATAVAEAAAVATGGNAVATGGNATGGSATGGNATGGSVLGSGNSSSVSSGGDVSDSGNSSNVNTNVNTATGGSATTGAITNTNSATTGAITNTNSTGPSTSSATGGQGGQGGASSSGGNTLQNVTNYKRNHRAVASSNAPLVIPNKCQGSVSLGVSTGYAGASVGWTKSDKFCQLLELRRQAGELKLSRRFQCDLLATDRRWAKAMASSGETCAEPVVVPTTVPTVVVTDPIPPVPPREPENG